jgi:xanthine dehydrogenase accessory factor
MTKGFGQIEMLIRFVSSNAKDASPLTLGIGEVSDLDSLRLAGNLRESLETFWQGRDQILYLELPERKGYSAIIAERVVERQHLFVFGAGHVGRSIALLGLMVGLEVTLIDDREEFLLKDGLVDYGMHTLPTDFTSIHSLESSVSFNKHSAIVIVTRGHQSDEVILKQVASFGAGYVGMIGSRRRVASVFRRLREQGVSEAFLKGVKAPIGLDIGARTPQEIAVAVHAEIIKHFRGVNS